MSWRDDRDDERHVQRWRERMLDRHRQQTTQQRIKRAGFQWRSALRFGVLAVIAACAFAAASVAMQHCSGQL